MQLLKILSFISILLSLTQISLADEMCLECHGEKDFVIERDEKEISLYVDSERFQDSVHGENGCISCHEDADVEDGVEPELLISYAIMDKEKRIEKYIKKVVQPILKLISDEFKSKNDGNNLSEVTQFKYFKDTLDKLFGTDTENVDQKLKGTFY